jgi:hypothetical protein
MTDANTELIWLAMGNPTRNVGAFYEAVFGAQRDRWHHRVIDSRDVEGCNVEEINSWLTECEGNEDADYFRVRARGLFPKGASGQFIDLDTISKAQVRQARSLPDDPLIAGADFAWGGGDDNVVRFRKGYDGRCVPPIKVKGEFTRDPAVMTGKLADVLTKTYIINGRPEKVAMLFADSAGIAGPVVARLRALGHKNIMEVNFGQDSTDPHFVYRRDEMWGKLKEWLREGAIDKDPGLAADLAKPMLIGDVKQRVKLESKEIMGRRLRKMGMEATSARRCRRARSDLRDAGCAIGQENVQSAHPASECLGMNTHRDVPAEARAIRRHAEVGALRLEAERHREGHLRLRPREPDRRNGKGDGACLKPSKPS